MPGHGLFRGVLSTTLNSVGNRQWIVFGKSNVALVALLAPVSNSLGPLARLGVQRSHLVSGIADPLQVVDQINLWDMLGMIRLEYGVYVEAVKTLVVHGTGVHGQPALNTTEPGVELIELLRLLHDVLP